MAEALATLSLVCNVMTCISFTGEVIQLYRATSKDGSPEPDLQSNTAHLSELGSTLQAKYNSYIPQSNDASQLRARNRLKSLISDLIRDTEELTKLLQRTTASSGGRFGRLKISLKYKLWYGRKVESIKKRIHNSQNIMNSELLNQIW